MFRLMHRSNCVLFDQLVGAGEKRIRHGQAESFGGLEIDHELILRRCLHGQVGGLLAPQNAIDVLGGTPELVGPIGSVGGEATVDDDVTVRVHGGQLISRRQLDDEIAMRRRHACVYRKPYPGLLSEESAKLAR
jgi:hypothetical protein